MRDAVSRNCNWTSYCCFVIIKITRKNEFSDDSEIDSEERHRENFVNRFKTDFFDSRNHID